MQILIMSLRGSFGRQIVHLQIDQSFDSLLFTSDDSRPVILSPAMHQISAFRTRILFLQAGIGNYANKYSD